MNPTGAAPPYDAVIFDMDGVVTDTAALHATAWKELFDGLLTRYRDDGSVDSSPFDQDNDYRRYVDGRTREDGVAAFLAARRLHLPVGGPSDDLEADTVWALAARKNERFRQLTAERGVRTYPSTVALLERLRDGGVLTALVSASRNAADLLEHTHSAHLFDAIVDGGDADEMGLAGKPDPAMFLEAARRLGVSPDQAAVVEDAASGVSAARAGGFALVVGIDRGGHRADLERAGADVVVGDVGELDLGVRRVDPWCLVFEGFDPEHERHREALTTLGNGYLGTRGASPESTDDGVHYPGTYLAGIYNRLTSTIEGRSVEDEHLVNAPNWLSLDLRFGAEWWSHDRLQGRDERRELDMKAGILIRRTTLVDRDGQRLHVEQRRIVSMARPHVAALVTTLVADGWEGLVHVRSGIDTRVRNTNVRADAGLSDRHLEQVAAESVDATTVSVEVVTVQSNIRIAMAARTTVDSGESERTRLTVLGNGWVGHEIELALEDGRPLRVEKTVTTFSSRDAAIASPSLAARCELTRVDGGYAQITAEHEREWRRLHERFTVDVDAAAETRLVLNLHIFHLLQSISPFTARLDAGVPARGLHGEGYRGHVFWDELFVLPLYTTRIPHVTRALLGYRWHRLDAARDAAAAAGLEGALFPWQSGSDGREETPSLLFNGRSGRWMPDHSHLQRHVGLAVAYNAWAYFQATGDTDYLAEEGAELVVEIARLFSCLATYDEAEGRYHISGVMGPDEYHDGYPGAVLPGLRDNTYTNVLAAWTCRRAIDVLHLLAGHLRDDLVDRLDLRAEETARWEHLSRRMSVPFHEDGIVSQFHGYESLEELDWDRYRQVYGNIGRLDLILKAEGDTPNRYKLAKQADVLMLVYLFGAAGLVEELGFLGYDIDLGIVGRTADYYLARTAHGSTLSRVVHASVLARLDGDRSWEAFRDALVADLDDTQGNTTGEGIHLGAMAGTADLVLRAYAGMSYEGNMLRFDPNLPERLHHARAELQHRGQRISVDLDHTRLRVRAHPCPTSTLIVAALGEVVTMKGGESHDFTVVPGPAGPVCAREQT